MKSILKSYLDSIYQTIDITVAVLLLTGQITIRSVIITTGSEFRLSVSGPIFGGPRTEARPDRGPGVPFILDAADVIVAFLLILGEAQIAGLFIQSQRFNLLVGGPPFGERPWETYVPEASAFFNDYREHILKRYTAEPPKRGTKGRD